MMPMPLKGPTWFLYVWRTCGDHDHRHLQGVFSTKDLCEDENARITRKSVVKKTCVVELDLPPGYFPADEVFERLVDRSGMEN